MTPGAPPPYGPYSQPQQGYGPQPGYAQGYGGAPPGFQPGFQPEAPRNEDASHLSVLSICTFVYAGFVAFLSLFGAVYIVLGVFMATSLPAAPAGAAGGPTPAAMGSIFAIFGGIFMVIGLATTVALVISGLGLRKRRRRTFSFVVACLICLNVPFGTALGVFTLIVLSRASVKALYEQRAYEMAA